MNIVEPDIAARQVDGVRQSARRTALPVFIVPLFVFIVAGPAAADKHLVLAIGSAACQCITKLDTPQDDAKPIAGTLQGIGFTLVSEQAAPPQPQETPDRPSGPNGGYVVLVSSQRSEELAQAAYKGLQSKFPNVLGSRAPIIRRAETSVSVYYRALVGPFDTADGAAQFCGSLKAAGGQCVVRKNY